MSGTKRPHRFVLAAGLAALAALPAASSSAGVGGGEAPRIVGAQYYEKLKGMRHVIVADVNDKDATVFAVVHGTEYDGRLTTDIHHGTGIKSYLIRHRKFVRGVLEAFDEDGVAKFKLFAGNGGGLDRRKCKLELERDPRGDFAEDNCRRF